MTNRIADRQLRVLAACEANPPRPIPIDITDKIGPLDGHSEPEWPMYSFERPAYLLWNALANELKVMGWTEKQIQTWLQSKEARWALDGALGQLIEHTAQEFATQCKKAR